MKIMLEFETHDLREMIQNYFEKNGFAVLNLEEICTSFNEVFPGGLRVQAAMTAVAAVPVPPSLIEEDDEPIPIRKAEEPELESTDPEENPALNLGDLMDPTPRRGRTELKSASDETDVVDIQKLVRTSRNLERAGKPNV